MNQRPSPSTGDALLAMRDATRVAHAGPAPRLQGGALNPPVHRASTIVYDSVEKYMARHQGLYDEVIYGLYGTQTNYALSNAIATIEGGQHCVLTPSGTSAITLALSAVLGAGDHVLVVDSVYGPTRRFLDEVLTRFGVAVDYFDPLAGAAIADQFRDRTRAVYMEAPGSQTFEMIDVPAVTAAARRRGIVTLLDNTWATPLYFRPLAHGVDISIASATKYLSGHSDVMLGALSTASDALYEKLKDVAARFGICAAPDDCYLVHRGLRTLDVRLERHQRNARALIGWLQGRAEVRSILYPGLEGDPGYAIWQRDYLGASGLFGVLLDPMDMHEASAFFDHFDLFRMGSSWGGYESLIVPAWPAPVRQHRPTPSEGALIRIHAGLEDPDDLIADLERGFARLGRARGQ
jgi:cystathionine beta-lyase